MSNMSYCRFENTYHDLMDCLEALEESGDLKEFIETRNSNERSYIEKLIKLCGEISADFEIKVVAALKKAEGAQA